MYRAVWSDWFQLYIDRSLDHIHECYIGELVDYICSIKKLGSKEPTEFLNQGLPAHAEEGGDDDDVRNGPESMGWSVLKWPQLS